MGAVTVSFHLIPPKHGGDLAYWKRVVGDEALDWLDLSSACNREPWTIPQIDTRLWMELPDQAELYEQASHYYGLKPKAIGSGSQQIIEALPPLLQKKDKAQTVMVPKVGYQEHAFAWQKWGYELAYYYDLEELMSTHWDIAVVINPNNPTGDCYATQRLLPIMERAIEDGRSLVVDEAFMDPIPEHSLLTRLNEVNWPDNVFVMRSVGKFFGLPGARVGFVFCSTRWQIALRNHLGPWPVATPSLYLVAEAFKDQTWQTLARLSIKQRQQAFAERIIPKLNTIFNTSDYAMSTLFTTWHLESASYAEQVFEWLHHVGIHVRLGDSWIRVALPAWHEMDQFNAALICLLKEVGGRELV